MEVYVVMYRAGFDEALTPIGIFDDRDYADAIALELVEKHGGGSCVEAFMLN